MLGAFTSWLPVILTVSSSESSVVMSICRGGNQGTERLSDWP